METITEIKDRKYTMPTRENYNILKTENYRIIELKKISRKYGLKVSGKKQDLINRIFSFLSKYDSVVIIQAFYKSYLVRKYIKLHGPCLSIKSRSNCVNDCDFLTLDDINDIPTFQFISFKDSKGFIYGFDICSMYNYLKQKKTPINPYTRETLCISFINDIKNVIRLSHILKIKVNIKLDSDEEYINSQDPVYQINKRIEKC
jgi:hypothetical protein